MPEVELSQTLTGLPMGTYIAYADVMVENNWAGNNVTTQRIFANDCVQVWGTSETITEQNIPADVAAAKAFDEQGIDNITHLTYVQIITFYFAMRLKSCTFAAAWYFSCPAVRN